MAPPAAQLRRGAVVEVPPALSARPVDGSVYDIVILGAGCAGLSLCIALLAEGETGSILLVDSRTDYADDRTWCFWDVEPTRFTQLARAAWPSWQVRSADGVVTSTSSDTPYLSLSANDFYRFAMDQLSLPSNVSLLMGAASTASVRDDGLVEVESERCVILGRQVIDSRGFRSESAEIATARAESTWVPQQFVGMHVRTDEARFDPAECMLMDFDVDQSQGLRFVYALASSPTEMLVEDVSMSDPTISDVDHRQNISAYLLDRYGLRPGDYEVMAEERGYIPMTDHRFARHPLAGVTTLGIAGGATRPSTGYTFLRIQRSSAQLARRIVAGLDPVDDERSGCSVLDAVFLRFLADHPQRAPRVFHLLFSSVEPGSLVRFLSEQSTWIDHARLILALPKGWFLSAAARVVLARVRRALS